MDIKVKNAPQLSRNLMWCLGITFTIITVAKTNYCAAITFIVSRDIFSKTEAGFINSAYFLVYSLFQIFGGKMVDRISPYFAVSFSIVGGIVTNLALAFTTSFVPVTILWTLNGFFQFSAWPGLIALAAEALCEEHKKYGVSLITLAIAVGSMLSYALTPVMLEAFGWAGLCVFNGVILMACFVYWRILQRKTDGVIYIKWKEKSIQTASGKNTEISESAFSVYMRSGIMLVFFVVLFGGIGAGVKSWIPTMMFENYNVSTIGSGFQTSLVYICNMFGIFIFMRYGKYIRNETGVLWILYGSTIPFALILLGIGSIPQLFALICFIFISTLTYCSINITAMMSVRLSEKGYGHSGSLAGIANGFSALSIVAASALFGYVADHFNWQIVIICSLAFLALSVALIIPAYFLWKRFISN